MAGAQQMRGSGSPTSMSTIRLPPKAVSQQDEAFGLGADLADDRGLGAERVRAKHARARSSGRLRRRRPRRACPRSRRRAGRCRGSRRRRRPPAGAAARSRRGTTASAGLLARARSAPSRGRRASGRAASAPPSPSSSSAAASSCTGAVSLSRSTSSVELAAGDHHRHAVVAERARDEHAVAGRTRLGAEPHAVGDDADAGGVDVERRPPCRARRPSCRRSRRRRPAAAAARAIEAAMPAQVGDREALLDDEPGREHERPRAGDRQIVDRPVDGQLADVAAGEEERLDDVRVGREGEPRAVQLEQRRVAERRRAAGCRAPRGRAPRRARASPCRRSRARA